MKSLPSVAFLAMVGQEFNKKGHGWARFRTRLFLSLKFSCTVFAWVKIKEKERESLEKRL